ncbi:YibE/F family protein [Desulfospira joergensenii]|uniref:YibE/F family protein n=1 Tax=Desulfospira joergensenii TaxID=53329 RepID=UPI0003B4A9F5|nr:YibE/F family protein [Desulfospira joergensenii]
MIKKTVIHLGFLSLILAGITAYYTFQPDHGAEQMDVMEVKARVLSSDNSEVRSSGLSHIGFQTLEVEILEGRFKGQKKTAVNNLVGQTDLENLFQKNDTIIAALILEDGAIDYVKAVDLFRQDTLLLLFGLFVAALLIYAGVIGVKALMSFVLTVFIIWEVLVRLILRGYPPLAVTTWTLLLLSAIIIFLVAGINKKGLTAFTGTACGLFTTLLVTSLVGREAGLFGMTQPYVNALIFSGYYDLDIRQIFYSAIILGASGAAMDIAMDVAASMDEIKARKPDISTTELMRSGFNVGRQVIGTMTTTLLLAYSGGYLTLLMIFRVKEPSIMRMINLKIVAAEIMRTLVGSIGLVLVAPITAIVGGMVIAGAWDRIWRKNRPLPGKRERSTSGVRDGAIILYGLFRLKHRASK